LINPPWNESRRIRHVDLIQRTEAMPGIVSGIHQPVLRLLGRMEQPLGSHLRAGRGRKHAENDKVRNETNNARNFHCPPPFSLAASKNAMRSFRSFSGSAFVSYVGINDSRVFSKAFPAKDPRDTIVVFLSSG